MERLKKLREARHMTQLQLGMKLNVVQETISAYEIGRTEPNLETLSRLADELDTSVDYILGRTELPLALKSSDLNEKELNLLRIFKTLSPEMQDKALQMLTLLG